MCELIIAEHGSTVGIESGRIYVKQHEKLNRTLPLNELESIILMSNSTVTAPLIKKCLYRKIPITYTTSSGINLGSLRSDQANRTEFQRQQSALYKSELAFLFSKHLVADKLRNQSLLLYRHRSDCDFSEAVNRIGLLKRKVSYVESPDALLGIEGTAAKIYFSSISRLVPANFSFSKRSRRPPLDEVNSMLGFGYSFLFNLIFSMLLNHGINPYFGFYHKDRDGHASLVSDLMEEWRPVMVDAPVLTMLRKNMITKDMFYKGSDGGVYMNKTAIGTEADFLKKHITCEKFTQNERGCKSLMAFLAAQIRSFMKAVRCRDVGEFWSPVFR